MRPTYIIYLMHREILFAQKIDFHLLPFIVNLEPRKTFTRAWFNILNTVL